MEGAAFLGNANTFSFEGFQGGYAFVVVVGGNDKCGRGITFFFTTFVCNDGELLSAGSHVEKAGSNAGSTNVYLGRSGGNCDRMGCVEPLGFNFQIFFCEEALIHGDEKGSATGQTQQRHTYFYFFLGGSFLFATTAKCQ